MTLINSDKLYRNNFNTQEKKQKSYIKRYIQKYYKQTKTEFYKNIQVIHSKAWKRKQRDNKGENKQTTTNKAKELSLKYQ